MPITLFIPVAGLVAAASSFLGFGVWHFLEVNIVQPAPYERDLSACLDSARALEGKALQKEAENSCFRTYPHFN